MLIDQNGFSFYRVSHQGHIERFFPGDPEGRPAYAYGKDLEALLKKVAEWSDARGENNRHVATWTDEQGRTVYVFVIVEKTSDGTW